MEDREVCADLTSSSVPLVFISSKISQNHVVSAFREVLIMRLGGRFSMTEVSADSEPAEQASTA